MPSRKRSVGSAESSSGRGPGGRGFVWGFLTALVLVAAVYGVKCWFCCPMGQGACAMGMKGCPAMSAPATPAPAPAKSSK